MLDEDALEAMLARRKKTDEAPSGETVVSDETDEYEVYERVPSDDANQVPLQVDQEPEDDAFAAFDDPDPPLDEEPFGEEDHHDVAAPVDGDDDQAEVPPEVDSARTRGIRPQVAELDPAPRQAKIFRPSHAPAGSAVVEPDVSLQPPMPGAVDDEPAAWTGSGVRLAIVQARFNHELTDEMARLARAAAAEAGATVTHEVQVPGIYDLPLIAKRLAVRDDVDGVVVLGAVVKGETKHDEVITHATARTLQDISCQTDVPIGLGIIGPGMTWRQGEDRVGNAVHAVDAVLAQLSVLANNA